MLLASSSRSTDSPGGRSRPRRSTVRNATSFATSNDHNEVNAAPKRFSRSSGSASAAKAASRSGTITSARSEEHTSELQSRQYLVCRLLLEKKKRKIKKKE